MAEVSALERVLALAAPSQLEPSALGRLASRQASGQRPPEDCDGPDGEAHDHLSSVCAFYRAVNEGDCADPGGCKAGEDGGISQGALVKFTADTPRASTVHQPTVPPGGPGLFHVKGLQLPPYVQHLYKHLVGRYGKHGAYKVAVGVVKKWAAGINPGGWKTKSGKGKRTHPDVQAAAQRNVAEWEADKAKAHQHTRAGHGGK